MPVHSLKLTDNPINAPAERSLHTLRTIRRHKRDQRRFDEIRLRHLLARCIFVRVTRLDKVKLVDPGYLRRRTRLRPRAKRS